LAGCSFITVTQSPIYSSVEVYTSR